MDIVAQIRRYFYRHSDRAISLGELVKLVHRTKPDVSEAEIRWAANRACETMRKVEATDLIQVG